MGCCPSCTRAAQPGLIHWYAGLAAPDFRHQDSVGSWSRRRCISAVGRVVGRAQQGRGSSPWATHQPLVALLCRHQVWMPSHLRSQQQPQVQTEPGPGIITDVLHSLVITGSPQHAVHAPMRPCAPFPVPCDCTSPFPSPYTCPHTPMQSPCPAAPQAPSQPLHITRQPFQRP